MSSLLTVACFSFIVYVSTFQSIPRSDYEYTVGGVYEGLQPRQALHSAVRPLYATRAEAMVYRSFAHDGVAGAGSSRSG